MTTVPELVAVTGGSGFVGSHVVDALIEAGHPVRVIDLMAPRQPEVEWIQVDILDEDGLTESLRGVGPVFHLAAMADVNDVVDAPADAVAINVLGTARVLEAARRADAGRVCSRARCGCTPRPASGGRRDDAARSRRRSVTCTRARRSPRRCCAPTTSRCTSGRTRCFGTEFRSVLGCGAVW